MIAAALSVLGLGRVATSPYSRAIVIAILATIGIGVAFGWLKIHEHVIAREATAACIAKEKADRLEQEKAALLEAQRIAESTLKIRGEALRRNASQIAALEAELEDARHVANQIQSSCRVVFPADDPWLRRKLPKAPDRGGDRPDQVPAPR